MQTARRRLYAGFLFVLLEKLLAFRLVLFRGFLARCDLLFHHFFLKSLQRLLAFILRHRRLFPRKRFLQSGHERVQVQLDFLFLEGLADIVANAVAGFVFLIFELRFILR